MIIDYWKEGYTIEQIARFFPSVIYGGEEPSWQMINRVEMVIMNYQLKR